MKFQLIVSGLLIFTHIRFCEHKKHREHHEKNATRYCAGLLITGCAQQTFTVQNKPATLVAPKKPSPIISSFLELGRRKLSMQPEICGGAEMLLKQKPSKHS